MTLPSVAPVLRVIILDDDPLACEFMAYLLHRDLRVHVTATANSPEELISLLSPQPRNPTAPHTAPGKARRPTPIPKAPHVVLVDTDYASPMPLTRLIETLRELLPRTLILCHSQVVNADRVQAAYDSGTSGLLIKGDILYALATMLVLPPCWCACGATIRLRPFGVRLRCCPISPNRWRDRRKRYLHGNCTLL